MEEYNYIERRNQIRGAQKSKKQKRQSYFMLRLNMALALGVLVLCADMIDLDITNTFTDKVKETITETESIDDLKQKFETMLNGEGISVFAGEDHEISIDGNIIEEMHQKESAYENTQKKTP